MGPRQRDRARGAGQRDEGRLTKFDEVTERFERVMALKPHADEGVGPARAYVEAMLGLEVWSHKLYHCASAGPHEEHGQAHEHKD